MKENIHPEYSVIEVKCSCGAIFNTRSTLDKPLHIEVCKMCHPYYTGAQRFVDTAGRITKFTKKYNQSNRY